MRPWAAVGGLVLILVMIVLLHTVGGKSSFIMMGIVVGGLAGHALTSMKSDAPNTSLLLISLAAFALSYTFIVLDTAVFLDMAVEGIVSTLGTAFVAVIGAAIERSNARRGIRLE